MENTSDTITLSNINDDLCNNSGCTDKKLKSEIDQLISKRKKHKNECIFEKHPSKIINTSENDCEKSDNNSDSSSNCEKNVGKVKNKKIKDHEQDHKISHIDKKYKKLSQVTKDTRGDVLKILLILQKIIDDSRTQKQKIAKLEIKIKELDEKLDYQLQSQNHLSDNSSERDNSRENELKFDIFKQEVNTEILKINDTIAKLNNNFDCQISCVKEQLVMLFGGPIKYKTSKCC